MEERILSPPGLRGSYDLGRLVSMKYSKFLTDNFTPEKHHFIASLKNRCMLSAATIGLGMFKPFNFKAEEGHYEGSHLPPIGNAIFQDSLDREKVPQGFSPIPVTTFNGERQTLNFSVSKNCPKLKKNESKLRKLFFKENWTSFKALVDELVSQGKLQSYTTSDEINPKIVHSVCLVTVGDYYTKENHGIPTSTYEQCLMFLNIITFDAFRDPVVRKFRYTGIWNMIKPYISMLNSKSAPEFVSIVGHEKTVATMVHMAKPKIEDCLLDTYKNKFTENKTVNPDQECWSQVDFSSNVLLEVYETADGKMYVSAAHNGQPVHLCNTGDCTLEQFKERFEKESDPNPALLCGLIEEKKGFEFQLNPVTIAIGVTFLVLLVLVVLLFLVYRQFEKRRETEFAAHENTHGVELVQP